MSTPHTIDAKIVFSFQGETHSPSMALDLGELLAHANELPNIYVLLAKHNNIDTYSYLYDVMESYDIEFSNPQGLAQDCFDNGHFDSQCFEQCWAEHKHLTIVEEIAHQHLGVEDLDEQPRLKAALFAAYKAGQEG